MVRIVGAIAVCTSPDLIGVVIGVRREQTVLELALTRADSVGEALVLAQLPRCVGRKRTFQLLSRIVCHGADKYEWPVEAIETARQIVSLLLSRTSPFELEPAMFRSQGCNETSWWQLINRHKEWAPHAHCRYPAEFRQRVECALMCFKYMGPQLRYPLPRPIQYDIIRCATSVFHALFVC